MYSTYKMSLLISLNADVHWFWLVLNALYNLKKKNSQLFARIQTYHDINAAMMDMQNDNFSFVF